MSMLAEAALAAAGRRDCHYGHRFDFTSRSVAPAVGVCGALSVAPTQIACADRTHIPASGAAALMNGVCCSIDWPDLHEWCWRGAYGDSGGSRRIPQRGGGNGVVRAAEARVAGPPAPRASNCRRKQKAISRPFHSFIWCFIYKFLSRPPLKQPSRASEILFGNFLISLGALLRRRVLHLLDSLSIRRKEFSKNNLQSRSS